MGVHELTIKMLREWTTSHLERERDLVEYQIQSKRAYLDEINRVICERRA